MRGELDRGAIQAELLRSPVIRCEALVAARRDIEDTTLVEVLDRDRATDLLGLLDSHRLERVASGDLKLRLEIAGSLFRGPLGVRERLRRRAAFVDEETRRVGHPPGVGKCPVQRDVSIAEVRRL